MNLVAEDDLEPLVTECPQCQTRFRVVEAQLQSARGRVRCGACLTVFNGIEHLVWTQAEHFSTTEEARSALDELLSELEEQTESLRAAGGRSDTGAGWSEARLTGLAADRRRSVPSAPVVPLFSGFEEDAPAGAERQGDTPVETSGETSSETAGEASSEASGETSGETSDEVSVERSGEGVGESVAGDAFRAADAELVEVFGEPAAAPEFGLAAERGDDVGTAADLPAVAALPGEPPLVFGEPAQRRPLVSVGIVVAVLGIALQVLWYQFDAWSRTPFWRPVYAQLCGVVGCQLPVQRDVNQLRTRNLVVRSHPTEPGALAVNAVIANEAIFDQPFPDLELRFTSMSGELVARRVFAPPEYLAGEASKLSLMPARTPVQIQLDIEDPGPNAVNYTMKIR